MAYQSPFVPVPLPGAVGPLHHVPVPAFRRNVGKNMILQLMVDHGFDCSIGLTVNVETFLATGVVLSLLTVAPVESVTLTSRVKLEPFCSYVIVTMSVP